jgi:hypothetical protein
MKAELGIEKRVYPGPFRAAYLLWKSGFDLREVYSRSSYFRYKRFFKKKFQVDIDIPPSV